MADDGIGIRESLGERVRPLLSGKGLGKQRLRVPCCILFEH
jgi:hypothetical protein